MVADDAATHCARLASGRRWLFSTCRITTSRRNVMFQRPPYPGRVFEHAHLSTMTDGDHADGGEEQDATDPQQLDGDEYDERTLVERTDFGTTLTTKIKRGSEPRDQDEHTIKTKARSLEEAKESHEEGIEYLEQEVAHKVRNIQPRTDGVSE